MDTSDKILITGVAGFMGSHIVDTLINTGYSNLYGIDDLSSGSIDNISDHIKSDKLQFIQFDLSDTIKTEKIISDIKPNIIFHLAANAREGASLFQPIDVTRRNYLAYINILEPAIKYGLDKIILFSSMAVYGDQKTPFSENMKRMPKSIYSVNKAAMEHSTELLSKIHDFRYTIIRPHNVFGKKQNLKERYRNVICIFMNRIMRGETLYIYGDGEQKRAFSYIDDSLHCYIRCMEDKVDGEIINIGGIYPTTINKISEMVCKYMGTSPNIYSIEHIPDRPNEVKDAHCSYDKSVRLLGYSEKIGLEKGIENMAQWAKMKGPQEWNKDKLSLYNEMAPITWK